MIKKYLMLNEEERDNLYSFINRNNEEAREKENIEKELLGEIYGYGEGVLVYLEDNKVYGKLSVVLEVAEVLKTIYIHSVDILNDNKDKKYILKAMLEETLELANKYKAEKRLLGINDDESIKVAKELGLYSNYAAYKMTLQDKSKRYDTLDLIPLSDKNINQYLEIYNESFMDMPHGTYIDKKGVSEYLDKQNKDNYYFMVKNNDDIVGFCNCSINDNEGEFDIGLCKEYRGKGLGKKLLETAIIFLSDRVDIIRLVVIEKNKVAFNMYKKRGFIIESKLNNWIELKNEVKPNEKISSGN